MSAKILFISDLHKRYRDSTSVKGQLVAQQKVQEDIIEFNRANGITHNIIMGDWYDRGFHGLGQAYGAIEMDRRLAASVDGNVYLCVGNHFYLERDENPEMYIIQPNEYIKPSTPIPVPPEPIFKVVPSLTIGSVQISFFHYSKVNKEYKAHRNPEITYHVGVYHDDVVVPGHIRAMEGYTGTASQAYLNEVYANVDLAVHGHIHSKVGAINMELLNGRQLPMFIPGALGIVSNRDTFKHKSVDLPILEINDDGTVSISTVEFLTHIDELRFFESKQKKKSNMDFKAMEKDAHLANCNTELQSLSTYLLKCGYHDYHMNLVNAARSGTLDISTAITLIMEEDIVRGN